MLLRAEQQEPITTWALGEDWATRPFKEEPITLMGSWPFRDAFYQRLTWTTKSAGNSAFKLVKSPSLKVVCLKLKTILLSLRSRRLEVVRARKNGRARGRHACLSLARYWVLSCSHYFQAPATLVSFAAVIRVVTQRSSTLVGRSVA